MALRRIVFIVVSVLIGAYYLWAVRAAGHPFRWGRNLDGYYNYLAQAFAEGHLYLPVAPARGLLALRNPYEPGVGDDYKLWDAALYRGKYYLYHGAGPALILFLPWRVLSRHDLPENFALFLFCFGGYLFSAGSLLRILSLAGARTGPGTLALMLMALGICQGAPYLMSRVWVYEIAVGAGYFCVSGAFFLLTRSLGACRKAYWLAGSGALFGLAISCRPTLAPAAVAALVAVAAIGGDLIAFMLPLGAGGLGIALYNFARFGNPFEFGIRYLLSGPFQNRIRLEIANIIPGFYYNLFCRPGFDAVFPWVRTVLRYPFDSAAQLPKEYFLEPTTGALFLAPFIAGAALVPRYTRSGPAALRILLWSMAASGAAILILLTATGFITQRYEADFLPMLTLPALATAGIYLSRMGGWRRVALRVALAVTVVFGMVVSLALAVAGPYDDLLKNRPLSYARLARWFSPVREFRPMMNPRIDVEFLAEFGPHPDSAREPLVTIGNGPYRQFLYAQADAASMRFVLKAEPSVVVCEMPTLGPRPVRIQISYTRQSGKLSVAIDGREALAAHPGIIFTAPSQVTVGENRIDRETAAPRFAGRIRILRKIVRPDQF